PELGVADFRIGGDEEKTKFLLQNYAPRYDVETGQPRYFFYNEYGNQVMSLTGYSKERPFLIVAIDVYAVGESYQKKHFQMKDKSVFISESGFFIGARPSATSLILAIPNVTGANEVIKKKGAPDADEKNKKVRTLRYQIGEVKELENKEAKLKAVNFGAYTAEYRFYKNKLSRFTITVNTSAPTKTRL
ncbi:MAG: hypothetical protein LH614_12470, partial [Pyrinomonadaceae bacterium]|nr:hypothetical protein [Pyrinomonadaceae bacterium]